jgi:hypothetical protein
VSSLILFPLFAIGVVDTCGKFTAGVIDAGGDLPAVLLSPVANLPPVPKTLPVKFSEVGKWFQKQRKVFLIWFFKNGTGGGGIWIFLKAWFVPAMYLQGRILIRHDNVKKLWNSPLYKTIL